MKSKLTNRSTGTLRHRKAYVAQQNRERRQYHDENKRTHKRAMTRLLMIIDQIDQSVPESAWLELGRDYYAEEVERLGSFVVPDEYRWGLFPGSTYEYVKSHDEVFQNLYLWCREGYAIDRFWAERNAYLLADRQYMPGYRSMYWYYLDQGLLIDYQNLGDTQALRIALAEYKAQDRGLEHDGKGNLWAFYLSVVQFQNRPVYRAGMGYCYWLDTGLELNVNEHHQFLSFLGDHKHAVARPRTSRIYWWAGAIVLGATCAALFATCSSHHRPVDRTTSTYHPQG
jgi:hypothetical protein